MSDVPAVDARRRITYLWIEVGVVLLACLVPFLFASAADMYGLRGERPRLPFVYHALEFVVDYIGKIALVLFIIWRSNDSPRRFGLRPFHFMRDILGGIAIYAVLLGANRVLWWSLRSILSRHDYSVLVHTATGLGYYSPSGTQEYVLLAVMCLLSGFGQELVMRAYLIVRFEELFASTPVAFFLSSVLFACYHGYEGTAGFISVALFGLIEGVVFCLFRRLAPISLAHALANFVSIGNVRWL